MELKYLKMKSNTVTYLIISLLLATISSFAQNPSSIINPDSLNVVLLENIIKLKIDSIRLINKKKPLILNDTLEKAAIDQVKYLKKIRKLSHFQNENVKKKTPADRVVFYGLKNTSTAENIANTYVFTTLKNKNGKEYINNTYLDVAKDFIFDWVNSPGHYTNLINAEYSLTGIAISYDKQTKEIFAVQVFSSKK
jgi:uncharacterized protein YkwD